MSKVKYLHMQIRWNKTGIQRGPSHAITLDGRVLKGKTGEHRSYPLTDTVVLFGFRCSMASSGHLPWLHRWNISLLAVAHLRSYVTLHFLQALLEGGEILALFSHHNLLRIGFFVMAFCQTFHRPSCEWEPGFEWGSENVKGGWENAGKISPL